MTMEKTMKIEGMMCGHCEGVCKESNWKTLALLKFCLFAMGMLIGNEGA